MELFDAIRQRRSYKLLVAPAPEPEHLERILGAAGEAPDHQLLRPWRFVVIEGDAKDVLAHRSVDNLLKVDPTTPDGKVDKERSKFNRAPMVIAVATTHVETKLPFSELVSATAAAVQNLLLAATALGYGTIWRSGAAVDDPWLKAELGFRPDDVVIGFVYIGTVPDECPAPGPKPDGVAGTVRHYTPT